MTDAVVVKTDFYDSMDPQLLYDNMMIEMDIRTAAYEATLPAEEEEEEEEEEEAVG